MLGPKHKIYDTPNRWHRRASAPLTDDGVPMSSCFRRTVSMASPREALPFSPPDPESRLQLNWLAMFSCPYNFWPLILCERTIFNDSHRYKADAWVASPNDRNGSEAVCHDQRPTSHAADSGASWAVATGIRRYFSPPYITSTSRSHPKKTHRLPGNIRTNVLSRNT